MDKIVEYQSDYYDPDACQVADLARITGQRIDPALVPFATELAGNIPIYSATALEDALAQIGSRRAVMGEWARVLHSGPGVFVIKGACPDLQAIDAATDAYDQIIAHEKLANGGGADHFATAGANDRIWNSLQKLCLAQPEVFVRYFANPCIDAACEAWLGPNYQMTAQVNLVHPGGQPQQAHRDYHLGFQTAELSAAYPAHVHDLSPLMTLQGGIAHCDVPIASGPTKLLPFSQLYKPGYAAWRAPAFRAHFEEHHVQVPLKQGDAIFFSPALFHAAGANLTQDVHRMVNLLQVSSPFGRAMETLDRMAMCKAVFPALRAAHGQGALSAAAFEAVLGAVAEGYSFPTNLDRDPPANGLAPITQKEILRAAVVDQLDPDHLHEKLDALDQRRLP